MRSTRRTGVLAVAASLALAAGVVTAGMSASAGTVDTPSAPGIQQEGTLTLTTSSTNPDQVSFSGQEPQALSTTGTCDLLRTDQRLLAFQGYLGDPVTGTTLSPGFLKDSIGVNEKIASLCNKVDAVSANNQNTPETLELKLGDSLKNVFGTKMLATKASLDIELRSSGLPFFTKAKVEATAWITGNPNPVGTFNLYQAGGTSDSNNKYCSAGDNVNCQWDITSPGLEFDTLRLKAVKGSFSLEGGGDSQTPPTKATTFDLISKVDNLVPCANGTVTDLNGTKVTFVGNADPADGCVPFGAVLTSEKDTVSLLKSPTINPSAQFVFDIDWTLPGDGSPSVSIPAPKIDFEIGPVAETTLLPFCKESAILVRNGETGRLGIPTAKFAAFVANNDDFPDFDKVPASTTKEYACVDKRAATVTPKEIKVKDTIFAIGDLRMTLGK